MNLESISIRDDRAPQIGLALYNGDSYIANYQSLQDCIMDLVYHFSVSDLEHICEKFKVSNKIQSPYRYRGICSEYFYPTERVNSYVYYANSLTEIFAAFETHERRALLYPQHFSYGVQGCGIHLFNPDTGKYEFWLGGNVKSVPDIIRQAKEKDKFIPDDLIAELSSLDRVDVFISHKSEDIRIAKQVYDFLLRSGYCVFLSEISLPAISNADYAAEIDRALDRARNLIVIADSLDKVESGWVKYEWSSFSNEKRSGRKQGNLITLITENMDISALPFALRQSEVIPIKELERVPSFIV